MNKFILPLVLMALALPAKAQKRFLIDTHNDALSAQALTKVDLGKLQTIGNFDLVRAARGHQSAQVFSIWCGWNLPKGAAYAIANREIDSLYALVKRNPRKMVLAHNVAELQQAYKQHRFAAMIGVEGGHMIEERMDYIDSLAKRGMRYLTLTWNNSTSWATSAWDETLKKDSLPHKGLTDYGRQIVHHLNDLGVLVDVSHVGEATFNDVMATSRKPVIASHSCAYTLCPFRRNLKDEQLKALARNGGVVFLNFYSGFLDSTYDKRETAFLHLHQKQMDSLKRVYGDDYSSTMLNYMYKAEADSIRPPLSILIKHIDYIVKLIGAEHVGLGSDFDGSESQPQGMDSVADYPKIADELKKLHYTKLQIDQIFGLNFLRVLAANEQK